MSGEDDLLVIERVRARIMEMIAREKSVLHRTVRADAGGWETVSPGIERKQLWERGEAASCLLRIAPGTSFPHHNHPIDEECLVLEGSLRIGDVLLRQGDFHVGVSGIEHDAVSTDDGCVCFLRTARCFFEPAP